MLQVIILVLALLPSLAHAEARIALVIGNQNYGGKVQPLKNPHNDVKVVGNSLEADGFRVTMLQDATRRQMLSAVKRLGTELAKAGADAIGFLYYSGHGVARPEDHANYLLPVDLKDTDSTDFWFDALKLDDIIGELERAAPFAAHFVVFDACRDELRLPYRSASKGFEAIAERSGMFIAFATALGAVALDAGQTTVGSGPYASMLSDELVKPGQDHLQLFQNVKEGVYASTGHHQVPWERNGLLKRVYFAPNAPAAAPTQQANPDRAFVPTNSATALATPPALPRQRIPFQREPNTQSQASGSAPYGEFFDFDEITKLVKGDLPIAKGAALPPETPPRLGWGRLGVRMMDAMDRATGDREHGAHVLSVQANGPAAKAGIREDDVIIKFNGREVGEARRLLRFIRETDANEVELVLRRNAETIVVSAVLDRTPVQAFTSNEKAPDTPGRAASEKAGSPSPSKKRIGR
jgi:hypothetical protein